MLVQILCSVLLARSNDPIIHPVLEEDRPDISAFKKYPFCYTTGFGYVYARTEDGAKEFAEEINRAGNTYRKYFGSTVPNGTAVEVNYGESPESPSNLASNKLFWLFPVIDARNSSEPTIPYPVAHELGHLWYYGVQWKYRPHSATAVDPYGSPAEDYLDEIAAILLEPDREKETRRIYLLNQMAARPSENLTWPLKEFTVLHHPNSTEQRKDVNLVVRFYSQCLLFSDYLIETTKNEKIFAAITEASTKGKGFAVWLKEEGEKYDLPSDLEQLDKNWVAWIKSKHGSN
ncbi:MAG: hypothetical protein KF836_01175 [Fimbriimonadaceae bacterium]|nr:hypothetical protein [Fimbriimonadaceae bacterium]